jgi:ketosteroid isomerase-like protein
MSIGCERRQLSGPGLYRLLSGCCAGLMLMAGCEKAPPPVDIHTIEEVVLSADAASMKAAQELDVTGTIATYSDDALVMPPNHPPVSGHQPIHDLWASMLVPGTRISWAANKVESASSGDLVYVQGTYSVTTPGSDGKPVNDDGKYLSVWKKQGDGSWKEAESMWNSDLPVIAAPPAAPVKNK